jgi:hypothetical protein
MKRLLFLGTLLGGATLCRGLADDAADTQYYLYDIDHQLQELNQRAEKQARDTAPSQEEINSRMIQLEWDEYDMARMYGWADMAKRARKYLIQHGQAPH